MRRVLGLGDLLLIAAASIGPAFSLATTFGPMVEAGGSTTPLALLLIAAIMLCVAAGYRRLGERFPNAGSTYTWVQVAFGPIAGAYAAWILIVANIFAVVATSVPAGAYTLSLIAPALAPSPLADALVGAAWVAAAGLLLWRGLAPTSRVANALAVAEFVVLGICAVAAFRHAPVPQAVALTPGPGLAGVAGALVLGIWMIDGWEVSASTAEEARDAENGPGVGGLIGLLLTAAVLFGCMAAFLRVGTLDGFTAHENDALAYIGSAIGGGPWRVAITMTVLASLAAALQATLIYLTRSFFAMGRDGVLPLALGALDGRGQPTRAVVLLTGIGIAGTLASGFSPDIRSAFDFILEGTSAFIGALFVVSAAAAVRIFAHEPGERWAGVILPAIGTLSLTAIIGYSLATDDGPTRTFIAIAALAGVPLALWRGRAWAPAG